MKENHVDEEQILKAIVDEGDLSEEARRHLAGCGDCRARLAHIRGQLSDFGRKAERYAPVMYRKVKVPRRAKRFLPSWLDFRRPVTVGFALASVLLVIIGFNLFGTSPETRTAMVYREMANDEKLISEITSLEDDALPQFYRDVSEGLEGDDGETSLLRTGPGFGNGISLTITVEKDEVC